MSKQPTKPHPTRNVVHDDWKLRTSFDYLEYDIHTFAAGLEIYSAHRGNEIGNAALDSLLLRARLLMDFFFNDDARPDDVIALDYFHDFSPRPYKPRMTKAMANERSKINKRLFHLTTKPMPRLRSNQRYEVRKFAPQIVTAFRNWLLVVPDNKLQKPSKKSRQDFERRHSKLTSCLTRVSWPIVFHRPWKLG